MTVVDAMRMRSHIQKLPLAPVGIVGIGASKSSVNFKFINRRHPAFSRRFSIVYSYLLSIILMLSACAGVDNTLSPQERALRREAERFNQTVIVGAVGGAFAGALIGGIATGNLTGAGIGAGAGLVGGAGVGYAVASLNEMYARQEQQLQTEITAAQQAVARYQQIVVTAEQIIAQHRQNISRIRRQTDEGRAIIARIESSIQYLNTIHDQGQLELSALDAEINRLQQNGYNASEMVLERNTLRQSVDDVARVQREFENLRQQSWS